MGKAIKITETTKVCNICKEEKHWDLFYKKNYKGNKVPVSACIICYNKRRNENPNNRVYRKKYTDDRKDFYKEQRLLKKYGITMSEKIKMLESQNNRCKICNKELEMGTPMGVHVDHNHITDKVRGILCTNCNMGLGSFKDNPDFLYKAIEYLLENDFSLEQLIKLESYDH